MNPLAIVLALFLPPRAAHQYLIAVALIAALYAAFMTWMATKTYCITRAPDCDVTAGVCYENGRIRVPVFMDLACDRVSRSWPR